MHRLLAAAERLVRDRPGATLAVLAVVTVVLAGFASQQTLETDVTAFAPESELTSASERIADEFGAETTAAIQVIIDAGPDGDVLTEDGFTAASEVLDIVAATPELSSVAPEGAGAGSAPRSFAAPFAEVPAGSAPAITAVLADPDAGPVARSLLSVDLDAQAATARAGLVVVPVSPDATSDARTDAELALRDALVAHDFDGVSVTLFAESVIAEELVESSVQEMPRLLGLALAFVLAILLLTYRRVSDVLLGLAGLLATVVWTIGFSVLLGTGYLGVTGPLTQISLIIPVLLIGLAIDYAIHLTSRYREEVRSGAPPPDAASRAVGSVGSALVLATATTVIGFLTNVVAPLPPIRDFGLFVAGGVLAAFLIMTLAIPAARNLLDGRRTRPDRVIVPTHDSTRLGATMGRIARLSEDHHRATLTIASLVTLVAIAGATQVATTFSQDDFIPEDSDAAELLEQMDTLFGGDLDETTFVLLDGELRTSDAMTALQQAEQQIARTPGVRPGTSGSPVTSPLSVLTALHAQPQLQGPLESFGFDGETLRDDADVDGLFGLAAEVAPAPLRSVLTDDGDSALLILATSAGQTGAGELQDELIEAVRPVTDLGIEATVVSEPLLVEGSLEALTASQTRGILLTLTAALLVLVGYYGRRHRRPGLGVVTMLPSLLVVSWVLGSMAVLGISFNVMTAMVASLAIGIGVPYGIHVTNRFTEELERTGDVDRSIRTTVTHTGTAMLSSAATTAAGFGVLAFASLVPLQQFGIITALTITYSLLAAVVIQPAAIKLWARRRGADGHRPRPASQPLERDPDEHAAPTADAPRP